MSMERAGTNEGKNETISLSELVTIIKGCQLDSPAGKVLDNVMNQEGYDVIALLENTEVWLEDAGPEDRSELFQLYETLMKHTLANHQDLKMAAKAFVSKLQSFQ